MRLLIATVAAGVLTISPALAGAPAPLPMAGAAGPLGLLIAVGGYIAYRLLRNKI